jgi:tol-pal system protein YbgF
MRLSRTCTLLLFVLTFPSAASAAANKEHLQLMAEIRMLQEQQQQLQALLGNFGDALKTVTAKLDEQNAAARKAMADQGLTMNGIGENVRVLREKVDDTNVRVASVSQEIDALRQAVVTSQAAAQPATTPTTPSGESGGAPTVPAGTQPTGVNPLPAGVSPQRAFEASMDDFTSGRLELAITGFQTFIQSFPRSPQAADAQFYIGSSYFSQGKFSEARDAFQKEIDSYPQGALVPDAYFKLGQTYERLNQIDEAKKAYTALMNKFPNAQLSVMARTALERLNRR